MTTMTPTEVAIFIRQQYRTQTARDSTIKARYVNAREISMDTQLDLASAKVVATDYLAGYGEPMLSFDIDIQGVVDLDDFVPAPPQFLVTIPTYCENRLMRCVGISVDQFKQTSTLTVLG